MNSELEEKELALARILKGIPGCIISLSGGLDSQYLCLMAVKYVPGRVLCATIVNQAMPETDLLSARRAAAEHGFEHVITVSGISPEVRRNAPDRCYICKSQMISELEELREREGLAAILDGQNASDAGDDRPGSRAAKELGVRSPLAEAGLTKDEIRELAMHAGMTDWRRPASACLASRIPFGTALDDSILRKIDETEDFIRSKGIRMIRARAEGGGVRLELGQDENTPENRAMLGSLEAEIKALGWNEVEIDPSGYIPAGLRRK